MDSPNISSSLHSPPSFLFLIAYQQQHQAQTRLAALFLQCSILSQRTASPPTRKTSPSSSLDWLNTFSTGLLYTIRTLGEDIAAGHDQSSKSKDLINEIQATRGTVQQADASKKRCASTKTKYLSDNHSCQTGQHAANAPRHHGPPAAKGSRYVAAQNEQLTNPSPRNRLNLFATS
jgi:hypothetical protein